MTPPLIVIVGETASGKSDLALTLAKQFNGEIINADSWSVYRDFNIGTAKPSALEKKEIKHYLIDIVDPNEGFSAAEFKKLALVALDEIYAKGKVPILVGGTGLYIDCLIYDYSFLPASPKKDRIHYENLSLDKLVKMCRELQYDTKGLDLGNKRRVIRLIENKGKRPTSKPLRGNSLILGILIDPKKLEINIQNRTKTMMAKGLKHEVKSLVDKYGWDIEPMKGIGYREFREYFENNISEQELIVRINRDTLKLVKKQKTWFKRNKSIQWYINRDQFVDAVTTFMNKFS
jgi:tRNA dimethylallyltransferase